MNRIRTLRSRNYKKVIEVQVPVRFYWDKDGYDGFEFGSLEDCSRYQLRLLRKVIEQLAYEHDCAIVTSCFEQLHPQEWHELLDRIEAETSGIPKSFIDAFSEDAD